MTLFRIKGEDHEVSENAVSEARAWVADCLGGWADLDDEGDVDALSDRDLMVGVDRNYDGGIEEFLRNNS